MNQMFSTVSSWFFSVDGAKGHFQHILGLGQDTFLFVFFPAVIFAAQPLRLSPFFIVFIGIKGETMETKKGLH